MNKLAYRVIFNKNRGLLMAVAEDVASQGKSAGSQLSCASTASSPLMRLAYLGVAVAALFGSVTVVSAQIVADPNAGNRRPTVSQTASGIPLVNIVAPNSSGLSHNQYSTFNVGSQGAILNNARTVTQTQQAGFVAGNPNLANGSARIILNEVTGTGRSQLNGYIEVAGQQAQVIVANGNGISCSGCGFINTSRGVLTTGTPIFGGDGSLSAFRVTGGDIQIGAGGLNANNMTQTDLIARSVAVNGQLQAQNLNVITGTNQVNYADLGVTVIQGDNNKPTVGIDVASLGGMYANKIKLVGTEAGVGVVALGNIGAQAGDLNIDNSGKVTFNGSTTASGQVRIVGNDGITNTGTLYGQQAVALYSAGQIANSGTVAAQSDVTLFSGSINSTGVLGAGVNANGQATQAANLNLVASGAIAATGTTTSGGAIAINGASIDLSHGQTNAAGNVGLATHSGDVNLTGATLQATGPLDINAAGAVINDQGKINVSQLTSTSASLSNVGGTITQSGSADTSITTTGTINNNAGIVTTNGGNLTIQSGDLNNSAGQIHHAGSGTEKIHSAALTNVQGVIDTNGQLAVTAASVNNQTGSLSSVGQTTAHVTGNISNAQGSIQSGGALTVTGTNLDNTAGSIKSLNSDGMNLSASGKLTNGAAGVIGGNGDVVLTSANTANSGKITAAHNLTGTTTGSFDNNNGIFAAGNSLNVGAASLTNAGGTISAATVGLTATQLNNSNGKINATQLSVNAANLTNQHGQIIQTGTGAMTVAASGAFDNSNGGVLQTGGALGVTAASLNNQAGTVIAPGQTTIHVTNDINNAQGAIQSGGALTVTGANLDNTAGSIKSLNSDGLSLSASGQLTNVAAGVIGGNGNVTVSAGSLVNSSTISAAQNLSVNTTQSLNNSAGTLAAGGVVNASAGTALTNNAGTISATQVTLQAHDLANQAGLIVQSGTGAMKVNATGVLDNTHGTIQGNASSLAIGSGSLTNDNGTISQAAVGALSIATGAFSNQHGTIATNGSATINAGATTNSGAISAQQTLNFTAASLNNNNGTIGSNDALTLNAGSQLTNSGGTIQAGTTASPAGATVTASTLDNSNGTLGAGTIDLEAGTLVNGAGKIIQNNANGIATINVSQLLNNSNGTIGVTAHDLTLAPATLQNSGGSIAHMGTGALTVQTGTLSNNGGVLGTNGAATIHASSIVNQGGKLTAVGSESVTSSSTIDNSQAGYIGGSAVTLNATAGQINNQGGTIEGASAGATVNAQSLNNAGGKVQNLGAGAIAINVSQALNNAGGSISGKGAVTATANSIGNAGGAIGALGDLTVTSATTLDNTNGAMEGMGNVATTAQGALINVGGKIEALGSNGQLQVSGSTLDNTNGKIINVGIGLTTVAAATSITNADPSGVTGSGLIGGAGDVTIATPVLSNVQGGHIIAGGALNLNTTNSLDNTAGQLIAAGALTLNQPGATLTNVGGGISGGSVALTTASIDNTSGSIANPTGSGGGVAITTGTLTNTNGAVGSDKDLQLTTNALVGDGKIVAGRDGNVSLQGDYTYDAGNQITANRNLTLSTTGTFTNTAALAAAGNITVNAANVVNQAGADIASGNPGDLSTGTTTVNAGSGNVTNAGRIEGNNVNTTGNLVNNTGTLIGNNVTVNAATLTNDGAAAIIASVNQVNLWVSGTVNNQNGATLYSLGDLNMAANGAKDANGYLFNQTGTINNLSSTIEADGTMNVAANQINNVRQNVQTNTVTLSNTTTTMVPPSWWSSLRPLPDSANRIINANTEIENAYYVNPSQIVSTTPMVSPDGYLIYKVVVNLSASDSAFQNMFGGRGYAIPGSTGANIQYGSQSRVTPTAGTQTLYVTAVANGQTNPDQVAGVDPWSQYSANQIQHVLGTVSYSNQYGSCTSNCVRLQTEPDYTTPATTFLGSTKRVQADPPGGHPVEVQRIAHQVVTETQLLASSGSPAKITSGGAMHLAIGTQLNNNNGQIAAGGNLTIDGVASADGSNNTKIVNTSTQLTQTYTSTNQSGFGTADSLPSPPVQWTTWSNTPITLTTGVAGGTITSNQAVSISGGQVTNTSVGASNRPAGASAASLGLGDGIAPLGLASNGQVSAPGVSLAGVGGVDAVSTGGVNKVNGAAGVSVPVGGSTGTPGAARVVDGARAGLVNTVLPTNGLYRVQPQANQPYLIQTDPRFTVYGNFISSDYMLNLLGINPAATEKRLGDGFYEEKLISDQVTNLTGMRYLNGYANNEDEYKALMTNGAQYAKQFNMVPGIALSDAQMAALTTDIVWLVNQTVTLPDGSQQTVLVPQVYLAKNMDLSPTGALIAGNSTAIHGTDITNTGGTISGTQQLLLAADHNISNIGGTLSGGNIGLYAGNNILDQSTTNTAITNFGNNSSVVTAVGAVGKIAATQNLTMSAGQNLTLLGAQISAGGNATLKAGNAINVGTVVTGSQYVTPTSNTATTTQATHVVGSTVAAGGNLIVNSVGDTNIQAGNLSSGQNMLVAAGGNVNIINAVDTNTYHSAGSSKDGSQTVDLHTETNVGSNLTAGANATVLAGAKQDSNGNLSIDTTSANPAAHTSTLLVQGSSISAGNNTDGKGNALLGASGNISIVEAHRQSSSTIDDKSQSSGFLSSSSSHTNSSFNADAITGSTVSGNAVRVTSGGDLGIQGSAVAGTGDVSLSAKNNVVIDDAQNTVLTHYDHEEKKSGIFGTGGIGIMIGSKSSKQTADGDQVTQSDARSTVGSSAGNLTITAGKDVLVSGSDLIAGRAANDTTGATGNIGIQAQNIQIDTGVDTAHNSATQEAKQSGVGVAVTGTPLDTVRNLQAIGNNGGSKAQKTNSGAQELFSSSLTAPQVAVTAGSSSSNSATTSDSTTNSGSNLQAAGNINLIATGDGSKDANGKANNGNITIAGSTLAAGGDVQLDAQRDITVQSATDHYAETSQANSKSNNLSLAAPSPGDILRNMSGGPNSGGVGLSPYNASTSNDNSNTQGTGQLASSISGNNVVLTSHTGDITVAGSSIAAQNNVNLNAQLGQITVEAGQNDQTHHEDQSSHTIGDLGSSANGTSGTVGVRSTSSTTDSAQQLQNPVRSQITSQNGNVTLNAKQDITVKGSDLSAANNLSLIGENLNLDPGQDSSQSQQAQHSSQFGATIALGGMAGQVAQTVNQGLATQASGDNRVAALNAAKAGLIAANAANGITTPGGPTPSLVKVTVSIGGGSSDSKSDSQATSNQGSTLSAGKNVTLIATGNGNQDAAGFATDGDINARGTQISGQNVTLAAARDINLASAKDTTANNSTNDSSNASIGIGASLGGTQNGFTLELAAAQANGHANGQSVTNQNTVITGSQTTTIASGRDTNLLGAQVRGDTVNATVGRDLNIVSQQDTSTYQSVQNSSGVNASICVPPFCYGTTVQANGSTDSQNINSTFASVNQQSGIVAGNGGYNLAVKGNTNLVGGLIASSADSTKNSLTTGTLTVSDIQNVAQYSADGSHIGASIDSGSGPIQNVLNNAVDNSAGNSQNPIKGNAAGTTKSAISDGSIVITDPQGQQAKTGQTATDLIASINRDTSSANGSINQIFNLQTIQRQQQIDQLTSQIAQQAAPLLYKQVGDFLNGDSTPTKVLVHGLIGGLMAKAIGGNFGTGAAGAAAAKLAVETFGSDLQGIAGLSADEKNALVQLVGLTVGKAVAQAAGGTAADGNAAGVTAKLATQYNYLSHTQAALFKKQLDSCEAKSGGCSDDDRNALISQYRAISDANNAALNLCAMHADAACLSQIKANIAAPSEISNNLVGQEANAFRGEEVRADAQASLALNNLSAIQKGRNLVCGGMSTADCDTKILQTHGDASVRAVGIVLSVIGGGVASSAEALGIVSSGVQMLINTARLAGTELASLYQLGPVAYCGLNPQTCIAAADITAQTASQTVAPTPGVHFPNSAATETSTVARGLEDINNTGFGGAITKYPYTPSGTLSQQTLTDSCVAAACHMLAADAGAVVPEAYLRADLGYVAGEGASMRNIPSTLSIPENGALNATFSSGKMSVNDLQTAINQGGPAIISVNQHAIVVDSIGNGLVNVRDPLLGSYAVSVNDFSIAWKNSGSIAVTFAKVK